jgi:hypothetical protein
MYHFYRFWILDISISSGISPWQRVGRFEKQKNEHFVLVLYVK